MFKEAIAAKSRVSMPKPAAAASGKAATSANVALLSPVKVEDMMSLQALKFELSLVTSAIKAGHRDKATASRGRMVRTQSV